MTPPLGRLVIYTHKVDELAAFYARHFGDEILRSETDRIVELVPRQGGAGLMLHPAGARQKDGQVMVKLVFDVEDVAAFCEAAKARGLIFSRIYKTEDYEFANAKDPAKNSIQDSSRAFRPAT